MKACPKHSRMLTTTEVAQLIRVHPNTVRQWDSRELLSVCRLGTRGDRSFEWEDMKNFIRPNGHNNSKTQG